MKVIFYEKCVKAVFALCFVLLSNFSCIVAAIDLSIMKQDFVLDTKRIEIPGYPYVFNPSIVRCSKQSPVCNTNLE